VVVTARSAEKGQAIIGSIDESLRPNVSFVVVKDIAEDGAFDHVCVLSPFPRYIDRYTYTALAAIHLLNIQTFIIQVFQSGTTFTFVIHTASPYNFNVGDPVKDFLDPAIKGTTGILKSIKAYAPSVKRVVITSSSAAIVNPLNHEKVYDESKWAPFTWDYVLANPQFGYPGSKVSHSPSAHRSSTMYYLSSPLDPARTI
jgi:nucleoside-diphosphate-sugar epimerase